MIKYNEFINQSIDEKKTDSYEYGCAMLYFNFPEMAKIHDSIESSDLYEEEGDRSYGLEDEPHATLLYGLHKEVDVNDIKKIVESCKFSECQIGKASLFENEKYDVLKYDVAGGGLTECNEMLTKLPHTTDYPDYHPHMTIGYIKPGKGKKYVEMLKDSSFQLKPTHAIYSQPDGTKVEIPINQ